MKSPCRLRTAIVGAVFIGSWMLFRRMPSCARLVTTGVILALATAGLPVQAVEGKSPLTAFSTGGHSVYHLQPATVDRTGTRAILSASYDGAVLCHSSSGALLWKAKDSDHFPFDLAVADIDNDGLDEALVATAGGTIDAYDHDGRRLWSFAREAPFYQVCPVPTRSGGWVILAGGIEETLFSISAEGKLLGSAKAGDVVRHIRRGAIKGDGRQYAAVATGATGRNGRLSLLLVDPENLEVLWRKTDLQKELTRERHRFFSMIVFDTDRDGKEEIVLSTSWEYNGLLLGFDHAGNQIFKESDKRIPNANYRMHLLTHGKPPKGGGEELIFSLYANYLVVYDGKGRFQRLLKSRYDFSNVAFDAKTGVLLLGSSTSGGDGIYALNIARQGWEESFEGLRPVGRLAEVERNIESLKQQLKRFARPAYQTVVDRFTILAKNPNGIRYRNVAFASRPYLLEKPGDRKELWCRDRDKRFPYNKTQEEIIRAVREREAKGEDYFLVAGHSTAVYLSPATFSAVIAAGPKHLKGFAFSEMQSVEKKMQEVVEQIILPLAEQCRKAGKQIILENKNIFWAGTCYVEFWKKVLLNPRYREVFVPALEESNSRTQELSLAGRVGLWSAGAFDRWQSRSISDNPCFNRWWEWSSQQVLSHYLRHLVLMVSMGSDHLAVGIQQGPLSAELERQMRPLYELLEKGVLVVPKRGDLLSVADLCLGMRSPPAPGYLSHGINSHLCNFNEADRQPMVFDRLDNYWGGAPTCDHDFSRYGFGCSRRMLHFMPTTPHGMIQIVPDSTDLAGIPGLREKVSTDGAFFYDETGAKRAPAEYKPIMLEKLRQSAARLPVRVAGEAAWSVVRIDARHMRVVLVDPGYIDPAEREAKILLQGVRATACVDILGAERLPIEGSAVRVRIPAGLFRVIDIEHE